MGNLFSAYNWDSRTSNGCGSRTGRSRWAVQKQMANHGTAVVPDDIICLPSASVLSTQPSAAIARFQSVGLVLNVSAVDDIFHWAILSMVPTAPKLSWIEIVFFCQRTSSNEVSYVSRKEVRAHCWIKSLKIFVETVAPAVKGTSRFFRYALSARWKSLKFPWFLGCRYLKNCKKKARAETLQLEPRDRKRFVQEVSRILFPLDL